MHRQLRALTILDVSVQNAGHDFQRNVFHDEPLLERLRIAATEPVSDSKVRSKCKMLFRQWAIDLRNVPDLGGAATLYKQLPRTQEPPTDRREKSKVLHETSDQFRKDQSAVNEPSSNASPGRSKPQVSLSQATSQPAVLSSGPLLIKKSKKGSPTAKGFDLVRERPALLQTIASAQVASTNLNNALKLVNREEQRVSQNKEVMQRFEVCKKLRRQILRYIQQVDSDEFLGGLIHANEELVTALMAFEVLDKSVDDDSDSELEETMHLSRTVGPQSPGSPSRMTEGFAGLSLQSPVSLSGSEYGAAKPSWTPNERRRTGGRGSKAQDQNNNKDSGGDTGTSDEDDEDNPFGDRNATSTPAMEKQGFTWKEV